MRGSGHYREAEALLRRSAEVDADYAALLVDQAQAHATLALAAAQALSAITGSSAPLSHPVHQLADDDETVTALNQWHEVTR